MYVIQGLLSSLPVFWEARIQNETIYQIGEDGIVSRKRSELPLEHLNYWGIVCEQGRIGLDIEQNCVVVNDNKTECAFKKPIKKLVYARSITIDENQKETTTQVRFGVDEREMIVNFIPQFKVNFSGIEKKNANKQGSEPIATEQLIRRPLNELNLHGVGLPL
jgi:hypothetical protein